RRIHYYTVLVERRDLFRCNTTYRTRIGKTLAQRHAEQCRLSAAVRANERNALWSDHMQRDSLEHGSRASGKAHGDIVEREQCAACGQMRRGDPEPWTLALFHARTCLGGACATLLDLASRHGANARTCSLCLSAATVEENLRDGRVGPVPFALCLAPRLS